MEPAYEQLSRDELLALVELLVSRVQALEAENQRLRQLLDQLAGQKEGPPAWVKPNRPKPEPGEGKRRP